MLLSWALFNGRFFHICLIVWLLQLPKLTQYVIIKTTIELHVVWQERTEEEEVHVQAVSPAMTQPKQSIKLMENLGDHSADPDATPPWKCPHQVVNPHCLTHQSQGLLALSHSDESTQSWRECVGVANDRSLEEWQLQWRQSSSLGPVREKQQTQ